MKNFDKERFVQLLKYDVVSNWRNHVSFAIGAFLAHFAAQFGMIYFSVKNCTIHCPSVQGIFVEMQLVFRLWCRTLCFL